MDSITQAALGAAVAEAGLGRQLGNKAILWGAALGTLPDLDVIAFPFLDTIQRLEWHRGISHSLLFAALAAPILALLPARLHRDKAGLLRASLTVFLILATHSLIDVFTVYGTMVLAPFSDARIAFGNLFIIDPLFTAPLLLGLLIALPCRRTSGIRRAANRWSLILASLVAVWSLAAKAVAHHRIATALDAHGIPHTRLLTSPTPFNTIMWRGIAEEENGYWIGYHHLLEPHSPSTFTFIPKNPEARRAIQGTRALDRLEWFSNGFLTVEPLGDSHIVSDWRFGEFPLETPDDPPAHRALFNWRIPADGSPVTTFSHQVDYAERLRNLRERLFNPSRTPPPLDPEAPIITP